MANKNLTTITAATTAALTDLVYLVIGGNSRRMTLTDLKTVLGIYPTRSVVTSTGITYTLAEADLKGNVIRTMDNATAITLTIPTGLTGTEAVTIVQKGAGQVTVAAAVGVSLLSPDSRYSTRVTNSTLSIIPMGGEVYRLAGDIIT